jgi:hypothetical protein
MAIGLSAMVVGAALGEGVPAKPEIAGQPKVAASRVVAVTVYQDSALVTREVDVPEGAGSVELVVSPLPEQTVNSSLYSEGTDGLRILTTRFRMRPILEDTREEVRKAEAEFKQLKLDGEKLQSEIAVITQNLQMLAKLENFTSANLQHQTEKGTLNSEAIMALAKYVMDNRATKSDALVGLHDKLRINQEQLEFTQRRLRDLAAGSTKTERDAVIIVDKKEPAAGKIRLNYLVNSVTWHPQYKFRAGKEKDAVQVEYLAAVVQQTGEDWSNVKLVLSTAQPMLNSAPPDLKTLEVAVLPRGAGNPMAVIPGIPGNQPGQPPQPAPQNAADFDKQANFLRQEGQRAYNEKKGQSADTLVNTAGAVEQAKELLVTKEDEVKKGGGTKSGGGEGPSITYHLAAKLSIPSRKDEQVIEVAKLEMAPEYYYKAVPVLTTHVYRLANLTNKSEYVLLPGEATMYIGKDFVGRSELPLVAIGEQFTAGFGVDPQLQVQRQMTDKTRTMQGDNQVLKFEYRILISSYKSTPVKVQLWDRLPHAETEAVGVSLVKAEPEISTDALYQRENRPNNLLRWDLTVEPTMNGEKAMPVKYEFKLELGRQMMIGNFQTK